jgi:hypothetical protein
MSDPSGTPIKARYCLPNKGMYQIPPMTNFTIAATMTAHQLIAMIASLVK